MVDLNWKETLEIIWINILLSGDNAILIALACQRLEPAQRRWGVLLGASGGVVLRIAFTALVVELMALPFLKIVGALLLLLVAVKLLVDETEHTHEAKPDLWGAVLSIVAADAVMSLDNVLAIAAVAKGSLMLIGFGLAVSVPIVMFGAGALMQVLDRFPLLVWAGAGLLGWVAGDMAASDPAWKDYVSLDPALLEHVLPGLGLAMVVLPALIYERLLSRE